MEFALQLTKLTNNLSQCSRKVLETVISSSVELTAFLRAASTAPFFPADHSEGHRNLSAEMPTNLPT